MICAVRGLHLRLAAQGKWLRVENRVGSVPGNRSVRLAGIEAAEVAAPSSATTTARAAAKTTAATESTTTAKSASAKGSAETTASAVSAKETALSRE